MDDLIFHDPSGRRARRAGLAGGLMLAIVGLLIAGFFATLAIAPRMPGLHLSDPRPLKSLHVENASKHGHPRWARLPQPRKAPTAPAEGRPLSVGFYVPWDETSRASLREHLSELDVVSPQWASLAGADGRLALLADPQASALIANAAKAPAVMPSVINAKDARWNGPMADAMLHSPAAQARLVGHLVETARARNYAGYVMDLEDLSRSGVNAYPGFLARLRAALHADRRELWVTAPFDDPSYPLKAMAAASDAVVLMAYDQHYGGGDQGPIAGQDWYETWLARDLGQVSAGKAIVALGSYGYDWTLPDRGRPGTAAAVTFAEAMQAAHDSDAKPAMDEASLNPVFGYADENGRAHRVWFLDATTLFNEIHTADAYRPLGYALWRMGGEDPQAWRLMRSPYAGATSTGLETIAPGQDVNFDGSGEVLRVEDTPHPGRRAIGVDAGTGLVSSESYDAPPTSYVVQRYGAHPGKVAITFDDGPDERWTPKLLDILKDKHAPATFFVIGKNMADNPGLVAREVREGHNVGGHTWTHPNIGETPLAQTVVELNATQRLFETITGRSMRLFRPPYFGDAEPSTPREVAPLLAAQREGYLTVGLRIDPDDWKKPDPDRIVATTLSRLADTKRPGQIVLLHDSGGDRSRTVEALPRLVDALRANGYQLVTVSELAGMTSAEAMPPATRDAGELLLDRIGFGFFHGLAAVLRWLFLTAIGLGVARLLFLGVLALVHRWRIDHRTPAEPLPTDPQPLVSVLIPCFNEAKVVEASVRRILAADWRVIEVLVLDDGSSDGTSEVVRHAFADEPRVTLFTFANGGKARALNRGLASAKGEIVVALDADTLFPPDTIGRLARWFVDPRVGAVAGNAIVGNRRNLITRWQALEYVTAQNLERRALAALGAVTVVPGAVGAWRRSALDALGGYPADTLAEDQDLTLAVQRAGWRVEFDPEARAYTEAPETVAALLKQRFRWSFGTLQCLWKHRAALFDPKHPVLGFVALPQIWLFQIVLTAVAPLVDLAILWAAASSLYGWAFHPVEWSPDDLIRSLLYWAAFICLDLSAGALGMALERRAPWEDLVWMPVQRFGYRQLMYSVVLRSLDAAVRGAKVGWGKLERRATAALEGGR